MNPNQTAAFKTLEQAQAALKAGDKHLARQLAEQAAHLAPELEEVWLMLAASASPRASVAYLQKALQINPQSQRAQKGMVWATERLKKEQAAKTASTQPTLAGAAATAPTPVRPAVVEPSPAAVPPPSPVQKKTSSRARFSYMALLVILMCAVAFWVVWQGVTPAAAFLSSNPFKGDEHGPSWSQADVSKPTATLAFTPTVTLTFTASPTLTSSPTPTDTASPTVTFTPTETFTPTPSNTPIPSVTPIPSDTPLVTATEEASPTPLPTDTAEPTLAVPTPSKSQQQAAPVGNGVRWIDVDLTNQRVYAYEGNVIVNSFIVSTGTWQYPTVTGQYNIYVKYRYKDMSGPGYYLPNVPYTMFFYKGYALHGTYWHNNFGVPMSHGCVNLSIPDSEWLYNFASVGTLVNVHY